MEQNWTDRLTLMKLGLSLKLLGRERLKGETAVWADASVCVADRPARAPPAAAAAPFSTPRLLVAPPRRHLAGLTGRSGGPTRQAKVRTSVAKEEPLALQL